jgi:hypothetical protein
MATAARLAIAAWRNEACVRTIIFRGLDVRNQTPRMQIRLGPDIPNAPLIDLSEVTTAGDEGLRIVSAGVVDGVMTSVLQLVIKNTTMLDPAKLPYSGESGSNGNFAYALQVGGSTRLYGDFIALANVMDSNAAPSDRPPAYGSQASASPWSSATVIITPDTITVTIDGADALAPVAARAEAAATRAEAAAALLGDPSLPHTDAVRIALSLSHAGRSLVDLSLSVIGAALDQSNGSASLGNADYDVTAMVPLIPRAQHTMTESFVVAFFDRDQQFLRARTVAATFVPQADECWARVQVFKAFRRTFRLGVGAVLPARPFREVGPLSGLSLVIVGNSQVENGLIQDEIIRTTGMVLVKNSGNPGRDFGYLADVVIPQLRIDAGGADAPGGFFGAKACVLIEGPNEWAGAARPLGTIADSPDVDSTYGKIKLALLSILSIDRSIAVIMCGNPYRGYWTDGGTTRPPDSGTPGGGAVGTTIPGRATGQMIDDAIRDVARMYGQPFADLRGRSGISSYTDLNDPASGSRKTLTSDGLHWNATGAARVARIIAATINAAA